MTEPIYIPTNSVRGFLFLHTLSSIYYCRLFDDSYSDLCEVITSCSFDLHFSSNQQCWASFHNLLFICKSSLKKVCLDLPIFWLGCWSFLYWAVWAVYILKVNPLLVTWFQQPYFKLFFQWDIKVLKNVCHTYLRMYDRGTYGSTVCCGKILDNAPESVNDKMAK